MRGQRRQGQKNDHGKRCEGYSKLRVWLLVAALTAILCVPAAVYAAAEDDVAIQQPDVATEPAASETLEAAAAPAAPTASNIYRSVFHVEMLEDSLGCYWYDANGIRESEPQKNQFFTVVFDVGSTTSGIATRGIGKSGKVCYFGADGKGGLYTGWNKQNGKQYYYNSGVLLKGTQQVKGIWYVFDKKNGKLKRTIGDNVDKKIQSYKSKRKYMIIVKLSEHKVRVYKGKKNKWNRIRTFRCTVGKSSTPTPKGTYTIKTKGKYFNTGKNMRCWYYTQFWGNYLFHSVLYDRSSKPIHLVNGRLGANLSHGCIRLQLKNAKWINRKIPSGTKVVIF